MWPEQQAVEGLFLLTHPVVVVAVVARNKLLAKHKENVNRKEVAPAILQNRKSKSKMEKGGE